MNHRDDRIEFEPSSGEPFTMTWLEVADLVAFVREMKVRQDKEDERTRRHTFCPECGGLNDGMMYMSNPPKMKCVDCKQWWTP